MGKFVEFKSRLDELRTLWERLEKCMESSISIDSVETGADELTKCLVIIEDMGRLNFPPTVVESARRRLAAVRRLIDEARITAINNSRATLQNWLKECSVAIQGLDEPATRPKSAEDVSRRIAHLQALYDRRPMVENNLRLVIADSAAVGELMGISALTNEYLIALPQKLSALQAISGPLASIEMHLGEIEDWTVRCDQESELVSESVANCNSAKRSCQLQDKMTIRERTVFVGQIGSMLEEIALCALFDIRPLRERYRRAAESFVVSMSTDAFVRSPPAGLGMTWRWP
jgi:hypothetical protein